MIECTNTTITPQLSGKIFLILELIYFIPGGGGIGYMVIGSVGLWMLEFLCSLAMVGLLYSWFRLKYYKNGTTRKKWCGYISLLSFLFIWLCGVALLNHTMVKLFYSKIKDACDIPIVY